MVARNKRDEDGGNAALIRVYGVVQGVGYRAFTMQHAERLGLKGYVRNMEDGSVEVYVEGTKEKIEELIKKLEEGPFLARVEKLDVSWIEPKGMYDDFRIVY